MSKEIVQQVQKRMLISLAQIAKDLDIEEGDHVILEPNNGSILIRPVGWHDKSQEYFWSEKWQEKMKQSSNDMEEGRYKTFDNVESLIEELHKDGSDADNNSN